MGGSSVRRYALLVWRGRVGRIHQNFVVARHRFSSGEGPRSVADSDKLFPFFADRSVVLRGSGVWKVFKVEEILRPPCGLFHTAQPIE